MNLKKTKQDWFILIVKWPWQYLSQEGYSIISYPSLDSSDIETWLSEPSESCIQVCASPHSLSVCHLYECTRLNVCTLCVWLMLSMAECLCVAVCLSFLSPRHQPEAVFQLGNRCECSLSFFGCWRGWIPSPGCRCPYYWWCRWWSKSHLSITTCSWSVSHPPSDFSGNVHFLLYFFGPQNITAKASLFNLACPNIFLF